MTERKTIFFAYEGGHDNNRTAILKAISEFNQHQHTYEAKSWEEMNVGGRIITTRVFEEIRNAEFFACDLTYLNHNVLFELGFAIALKKRILIFVNDSIKNAFSNYLSLRILRGIGAVTFSSHKQILTELQNKSHAHDFLLQDIEKLQPENKGTESVLYLKSVVENEASLELTEILKQDKYTLTINDKSEVEYRPLNWYINAIYKASAVIIHLLGNDHEDTGFRNSEYSFYGGLAYGFDAPLLLLAPKPFKAPMDYAQILLEYAGIGDCALRAEEWLDERLAAREEEKRLAAPTKLDKPARAFNLLKLGVGFEEAENEKEGLEHYFIEMEAYRKAKEKANQFSIFVGRKGTGKSALFLKLEKELSDKGEAYNIILRPEALDLVESSEYSEEFSKEGSKRSFLNSIWRFLILGRLLQIASSEILRKSVQYNRTGTDQKICNLMEQKKDLLNLNFFALIKHISEKSGKALQGDSVDLLYRNFLSELIQLLREYFGEKKFLKINLLADNLDKTWDVKYNLGIQTEMLLRLIEYSSTIHKELGLKSDQISVNTIIFLREDIFSYILNKSREPDKLSAKAFNINWLQKTEKLKELIEERFRYSLHLSKEADISEVWNDYFDIAGANNPFKKLCGLIMPRPRDHIIFYTRMFESAVDHNRDKVTRADVEYAIQEYGNFLYYNLIAELRAEYPFIERLLDRAAQELVNSEQQIPFSRFVKLFGEFSTESRPIDPLIRALFDSNYIIGINNTAKVQITTYRDLTHELNRKKLLIFRHNIGLVLKPQEVIRLRYLREFA